MAGIPKTLIKCVLSGTIHSGQGWSTGFYYALASNPTFDQGDLNDWNTGLETTMGTDLGQIATTLFDSSTTSLQFTSYFYPASSLLATGVSTPAASVHAGTSSPGMPALCAVVASLRSATPGRSGRGRLYWPATAPILGTDGQISTSNAAGVAYNTAHAFSAMNAELYPGDIAAELVVASFTRGIAYPVISVVCDSLVDTQHRRQDKFTSAHTQTTAVT
uniref:Uncharacterized protein n=1 Tax=uncultured prokaryote TaxID=198431 RepID=A0A0H5QK03_9ZZZZ|nr:hypothetical protein [uncultured prokaryote]